MAGLIGGTCAALAGTGTFKALALDAAVLHDSRAVLLTEAAARNARNFTYFPEFREGTAEALPVEDAWADVVISNGVLNLKPDKRAGLAEIRRALKPGGRIQIGDIRLCRSLDREAEDRARA